MTSRIQEQRFSATATKPANGARPSGELWLNLPDLRLGLIDPAHTAVDLLGVRQYAPTSSYALGDYVVHAGDLLRSKAAITPHAFASTDWDTLPTKAANDALYTTQAQNDARYYTKTQSDANYYSKTYIDTNFYTKTLSDARYYTQAQSDARFLNLNGGTLLGGLTVGANGINYTVAGGSNHATAFGWDGANLLAWVDGASIGPLATQSYVTSTEANYLRLTGGTITGNLTVNGNETVLGTLQNSNGRLISYAPSYAPSLTLYDGAIGAMGFYYDGNLNFATMSGAGTPGTYLGRFMSNGNIEASQRVIGDTGVFANAGQDFGLLTYSQWRILQFASGWGLLWDTTSGDLSYSTPSGSVFRIQWNGDLYVGHDLFVPADIWIDGLVLAQWGVQYRAIDGFTKGFGWDSFGNLQVWINSGYQFAIIPSSSDERLKANLKPPEADPLEVLCRLELASYERTDQPERVRHRVGLVAQRVQELVPEAVVTGPPAGEGVPVPGLLQLDFNPLIAYAIGAIQQLSSRIEALEAKA